MTEQILNKLREIADSERVLINESMSKHTTFKVGGPADIFISIKDTKEAIEIIRLLCDFNIPYFIIGNGSNLLVKDEGYRGVIIELGKHFSSIEVNENTITADAGALLVKVANEAYKASLSGFEFASGIPGSVGGGVFMNAGAYGGEMKDIVESVTLLNTKSCEITVKSCSEMEFAYRYSIAKKEPLIILSAKFNLTHSDKESIKEKMDNLKALRVEKQPLEYPSAGSTFKRPEGYFAGKLIQDAGLKGYTVGGAMVSEKHSGFVINKGNATASDILTLISDVQRIVYEKFEVRLETEVCML